MSMLVMLTNKLMSDRCPGRVHKLAQVTALVKTNPELLVLDGVMHDLPAWKEFGGHGTVSGISLPPLRSDFGIFVAWRTHLSSSKRSFEKYLTF